MTNSTSDPTTDFDPVEGLAVHAPGGEKEGLFAVQGQGGGRTVELRFDPEQLASLATAAGELLQVLRDLYPRALRRADVEAAGSLLPKGRRTLEVSVAHFQFAHYARGERIALTALELPEGSARGKLSFVRLWLSREQVASLILQVERLLGLPPRRCPICGQPVGLNDHQCPREN